MLVRAPAAHVLEPPFLGEVTAAMEGVDAAPLLEEVRKLAPGAFRRAADVPWSPDAEGRVVMGGFASQG